MHRDAGGRVGRAGQIEIDGQVRHRRHRQVHGIAVDDGVGGDGHRRVSAEGQRVSGRRLDRSFFVAKRDVRGADRDRRGAVRVAEDHARPGSADAGVHDLPQRLIRELDVRRRRECLAWRCRDRRRRGRRTPVVGHERRRSRDGRHWILRAADFRGRPCAHPPIAAAALCEGAGFNRETHDRESECEHDRNARATWCLQESQCRQIHRPAPLRRDSTPVSRLRYAGSHKSAMGCRSSVEQAPLHICRTRFTR